MVGVAGTPLHPLLDRPCHDLDGRSEMRWRRRPASMLFRGAPLVTTRRSRLPP
ncbi:MAG: hypothetical protein ACXQTZ_03250 [Candidatus Alkanophagales archaeon]